MEIRLATIADAKSLAEFNQAMAMETEGKRLEDEKINNGVAAVFSDEKKGFYVVAEEGPGKILGGLMITYEWSDWRNAWFWWIQSVYILPEGRGKGIYSKLYDFVKEKGREHGICGIRLYVEKENKNAQGIYEHLGMEESHYLMYELKA
jgi:ribosomal protein S18 acetylase RimI-like enzyme